MSSNNIHNSVKLDVCTGMGLPAAVCYPDEVNLTVTYFSEILILVVTIVIVIV